MSAYEDVGVTCGKGAGICRTTGSRCPRCRISVGGEETQPFFCGQTSGLVACLCNYSPLYSGKVMLQLNATFLVTIDVTGSYVRVSFFDGDGQWIIWTVRRDMYGAARA